MVSEARRPEAGSMDDSKNFDAPTLELIGNHVPRTRKDKLASSHDAARPPEIGIQAKALDLCTDGRCKP